MVRFSKPVWQAISFFLLFSLGLPHVLAQGTLTLTRSNVALHIYDSSYSLTGTHADILAGVTTSSGTNVLSGTLGLDFTAEIVIDGTSYSVTAINKLLIDVDLRASSAAGRISSLANTPADIDISFIETGTGITGSLKVYAIILPGPIDAQFDIWIDGVRDTEYIQDFEMTAFVDSDSDGLSDFEESTDFPETVDWQPPVLISNQLSSSVSSYSVVDFDTDGDPDVFFTAEAMPAIAWLENTSGTYSSANDLTPGALESGGGVVADFDGDGDKDFAASGNAMGVYIPGGTLKWYENDGSENFTVHNILRGVAYTGYFELIDHNNDTYLDFAFLDGLGSRNLVWTNDGSGNFSSYMMPNGVQSTGDFVFYDDAEDGDLDFLHYGCCFNSQDGIYKYIHNGATWVQSSAIETPYPSAPGFDWRSFVANLDSSGTSLVIGGQAYAVESGFSGVLIGIQSGHPQGTQDFDGDGDADFFGNSGGSTIGWFQNDGAAAFKEEPILHVPALNFELLQAVDFDTDGDHDLLYVDGQSLYYIENAGVVPSPDGATDPFNPDTDGDGLLDGEEVLEHGTSPLLADTDGDGFDDNVEISQGSNPLLSQSVPGESVPLPVSAHFSLMICLMLIGRAYRRRCSTFSVASSEDG